jgi:hypothetical protein
VQKLGKKKEKKRKKKKMIKINKKKDSDLMTYIDIDATDHVMVNNNSPPLKSVINYSGIRRR